MNVLIVKLNATGDVVRTTTILHKLHGHVTWITAPLNTVLLEGIRPDLRILSWDAREKAADRVYDLVVNLEDEVEVATFIRRIEHQQLFGAYANADGTMTYTPDSRAWFDLSLISSYGRARADELKLLNRRTYQDLVFEELGFTFAGEPYLLPEPLPTELSGDVAIAPAAGPVWPMKGWAHYETLQRRLESLGLRVNVLPRRSSLLEHLADVRAHRCLVSGDSLPMHLALGTSTPCVTLFNCTSPWEIYEYGVQTKVVSPLLERYFYKRGFDEAATTAIGLDQVYESVTSLLGTPAAR
jgi:ADP-heptose:LPS heptosyltransferase